VLCLLSYVRVLKPPAGVEPAPRPYKGRVLAVDTTEALMETVGVEPTPPRCKRGALPPELHPQVRTGGVEPPQCETTGLQPVELTQCSASAGRGRSAGFEPEPRGSRPRMLPLHHDHHVSGDDRTRTGACSPDKRVLLPLSYVPVHSAGGIRTHDLELMRLARTASPLRRESARLESNQRSPAPKTGGVANSPTGRRSRR
jgi:hypothetical protein